MSKSDSGKFDLGITWNWEFDRDFIYQLNNNCLAQGLKPYIIHSYNIGDTIRLLKERKIDFKVIVDRASDTDYRFTEIFKTCQELNRKTYFINHPDYAKKAIDKILFHIELIKYDIPVPQTFIYYPTDSPDTINFKLRQMGTPVVMKPADGIDGGGAGVLLNVQKADDIIRWHEKHRNMVFLLQKQVYPEMIEKKPAWFRIFYILGKTIPCWWDPLTHVYTIVGDREKKKLRLDKIKEIVGKIARLSKLDLFSTEITRERKGKFIVIDYINDQCDLRRRSKYYDGVPDELMELIARIIVDKAMSIKKECTRYERRVINDKG